MIQIFGIKGSQPTRAAERFFKERRAAVQMADLNKKPMAPGEIKRFIDRFTLAALVDRDHPSIKYLKPSQHRPRRSLLENNAGVELFHISAPEPPRLEMEPRLAGAV
jgi:arsenate reductase-like glutaredoxin family protein